MRKNHKKTVYADYEIRGAQYLHRAVDTADDRVPFEEADFKSLRDLLALRYHVAVSEVKVKEFYFGD